MLSNAGHATCCSASFWILADGFANIFKFRVENGERYLSLALDD